VLLFGISGSGIADFNDGWKAYQAKDYATAIKEWRSSAEEGHYKAQYQLGDMYYSGEGVLKNKERSFEWYKKSADQSYALAQFNLGLMYDSGEGVLKDNNSYKVIASYPYHRPYRKAEELGYFTKNFKFGKRSIAEIYVLQKSDATSKVYIDELLGVEKFKALYYASFVNFDFMKQKRFEFFTDMLKVVTLYRVTIPWDKNRLNEVYETIVSHSLR
jgi:hypothetical protein